jgi:hypothetical protein
VLLPFPRPEWANAGDDNTALGSVLEWQPGVGDDERDRIEVGLAASGLLTAHLDTHTSEASTVVWRVSAAGPEADGSLAQVLTVDPKYASADAARAVLSRIRLADTAVAGEPGLVIGRDGTFAAGVLAGDPAAAAVADTGALPTAGFVGARTRRERALAEAERLDARARELDGEAAEARSAAEAARAEARAARAAGKSFPDRRPLEKAEAARSGAAVRTRQAKQSRDEDEQKAAAAAAEYQRVHDEWAAKARDLGMPAEAEQLAGIVTERRTRAAGIDKCVTTLRTLTTTTLRRTLELLINEDELAAQLSNLEGQARQALAKVDVTEALLEEVRRDTDADDAVRRHQEASNERDNLERDLAPAKEKATQDRTKAIEAQARVEPARGQWTAALPTQADTERLLSTRGGATGRQADVSPPYPRRAI